MSAWQPIETAPKDGKRIILFASKPMKIIVMARWVGAPHDVWIADNGSYERRVTHWMPLPAPPSAEPVDQELNP